MEPVGRQENPLTDTLELLLGSGLGLGFEVWVQV